ncbi:hypothetical protein ACJ41O_001140 [Fusarium nematophilum]
MSSSRERATPRKRKRNDEPQTPSTTTEDVILEKVAPDGDVIFVLEGGQKKIQAHSLLMKNASPFFAAMLSLNFSEGQALREASLTGQPVEIALPSDDFEAFKLVCIALHTQAKTKQQRLAPKQLMQVVVLADKYDLMSAISKPFQRISRRLILEYSASYMDLAALAEKRISYPVLSGTLYKLAGSFFILMAFIEDLRTNPGYSSSFSSTIAHIHSGRPSPETPS